MSAPDPPRSAACAQSARNSCPACQGSGYSNEVICRSPVAYRPCRSCNGSGSRPDSIAPEPGRVITCPKPACDVQLGTDQRDAELTHHADGSHTFHPQGRPKGQPAWETK